MFWGKGGRGGGVVTLKSLECENNVVVQGFMQGLATQAKGGGGMGGGDPP